MSDPNLEEILAWAEYGWPAEWCAKRGIENANGVFPDNLSARAWRLISADPESFASRIREFRYKLAIMTGPAWAEYDWAAEWCAKRGIEGKR